MANGVLISVVGAALWAADIESKSTKMTDSTAPSLRETAEKSDEL